MWHDLLGYSKVKCKRDIPWSDAFVITSGGFREPSSLQLNLSDSTEEQSVVMPRRRWTHPYSEDEVIPFPPHQATHLCVYTTTRGRPLQLNVSTCLRNTQLTDQRREGYLSPQIIFLETES